MNPELLKEIKFGIKLNKTNTFFEFSSLATTSSKKIYIYESPDKGKTIYQREFSEPHDTRELIITEQ